MLSYVLFSGFIPGHAPCTTIMPSLSTVDTLPSAHIFVLTCILSLSFVLHLPLVFSCGPCVHMYSRYMAQFYKTPPRRY